MRGVLEWLGIASVVMLVAGVVLVPLVVARMPADYFVRPPRRPARLVVLVLQNALGAVLVVAGIAMLVLPGQGVLTILVGLALVTGPGKRSLELWILRRRAVRRSINWLRRKAHRPPLLLPE